MSDIYAFLERHGIAYETYEHPAVFTCEEAERLLPPLPGAHTKNLFLKDKKGRFILAVVDYRKSVDLKALGTLLGTKDVSFASPEQLHTCLGVTPGSVTVLGLVHDTEHAVEVIVDAAIWNAEAMQCHPLVNTATLVLSHAGLATFLEATQHTATVMDIPSRLLSPLIPPSSPDTLS